MLPKLCHTSPLLGRQFLRVDTRHPSRAAPGEQGATWGERAAHRG